MKIPRWFSYLAVFLIVCVVSCMVLISQNQANCTARANSEPEAPIYPNATLVEKVKMFDGNRGAGWMYIYTVNASPEQVSRFYAALSGETFDEKFFREGEAKISYYHAKAAPFGVYSVTIYKEPQSPANFVVNIYWDRCTGNWEKSVEQ